MKVETEEQRNNPKRKKRLRKKLHVGEFRETYIEFLLTGLTGIEDEGVDELDGFIDIMEEVASRYGWHSGWIIIGGKNNSEGGISMITTVLEENGGAKAFIDELAKESGYVVSLVNSGSDAWYSTDGE